MNNIPIRLKVEIHEHLGFLMNQKATWHDHINSIIKKANTRLGIIKKSKYVYKSFTCLMYEAY
jgi:putative salt-induced outer membrane protein YdiY